MNEEISHIQQYENLQHRAQNAGLMIGIWNADCFMMWQTKPMRPLTEREFPVTLADLREAISNNIAARRIAGEQI